MMASANPSDPPPIVHSPSRRGSATTRLDDADTCRICRGEASPEQPLFYPCKCSGSIRFVHQDCLMEWLSHSQKKHCELCKTPFRFTKLYDKSMPENVPLPLFARQMSIYGVKALGRYIRYIIVLFIWLAWLPWTIRQIWRALFWLADGSWLPPHQALQTLNSTADQAVLNTSAMANTTIFDTTGMDGLGFMRLLIMLTSLISPATLLRFVADFVAQMFVVPAVRGEPVKWERAFLFAPIPRPPSLLSDVKTVANITNMPIINNAIIDVLEGQLICLAVVASFILVFLIREWVINQQPLLNMPDPGAAEQPVAPAQDAPQGLRRRRRALRNFQEAGGLINPEQAALLEERPRAIPRPRRRATDNNIFIPPNDHALDRPILPQRAASLVPALEEFEANARELENLMNVETPQMVESPPLERGAFDDVGRIQRTMEESWVGSSIDKSEQDIPEIAQGRVPGLTTTGLTDDGLVADPAEIDAQDLESVSSSDTDMIHSGEATSNDEATSADEPDLTPPESVIDDHLSLPAEAPNTVTVDNGHNVQLGDPHGQAIAPAPAAAAVAQSTEDGTAPIAEQDNFFMRLSKWMWDTEDFVPGAPPYRAPEEETEIIAELDAAGQPNVAPNAAARPAAQILPPNIQNGVNINDPNAVEEAEDIEGVLELVGMEGPIAGMIQNIIFSVFLITLTLSASVWCPYIWGKIALLFIAHPISVFFKAPLFLLSRFADFVVDTGLFAFGLVGIVLNYFILIFHSLASILSPNFARKVQADFLGRFASKLSHDSGSRIERMVTNTLLGFRPDLPTFSIQSHHVLRVFQARVQSAFASLTVASNVTEQNVTSIPVYSNDIFTTVTNLPGYAKSLPSLLQTGLHRFHNESVQLQHDLRPLSLHNIEEIDLSLIQWSAKEKIACIVLGYILFTVAGLVYNAIARWILKLKADEKIPGFIGEMLSQAGGVMKVVVIIGIEMIAFPLFCGTMLDIALLPMFEGASIWSRLRFFGNAPFTALFIHWFVGTCYMFHFALFVSMCRKLMRKGVLYFIRDPDDPSFHPVRDVLERPVTTQLGKIALSAFVYGSLLLICLGGMVATLKRIDNILPFRWGSLNKDMMIPGDIIYYNFLLPIILQKVEISDKVSMLFNWWFRACAGGLRLSDFFFAIDNDEEKSIAVVLWKRFFKLLLHPEEAPKHPMVKYIEDLANDRDRLVWCERNEGSIEDNTILAVFPDTKFKIVPLVGDKSQALIHFDNATDIEKIRKSIDEHARQENADFTVSRVKDMKVENVQLSDARKSPVDPKAGSYVRAPAKDAARIPKGNRVFLPVDENNVRLDQNPDLDDGLHGKTNDKFARIFVPTHFKARVISFVLLVWIFTSAAGLTMAIGPLMAGRAIFYLVLPAGKRLSDLYAYTVGVHLFAAVLFVMQVINKRRSSSSKDPVSRWLQQLMPRAKKFALRALGIAYLLVAIGFMAPILLAMLCEVYINMPVYMYLTHNTDDADRSMNPFISTMSGTGTPLVIHLVQTWAAGIIYLRLLVRLLGRTVDTDTRPAAAMRAIVRDGFLRPQVRLATRALVLPVTVLSILLLITPAALAHGIMAIRGTSEDERVAYYRCSYPILLMLGIVVYLFFRLKGRIAHWRIRVRDEIYLVGERLHNLPVSEEEKQEKTERPKTTTSPVAQTTTATAAEAAILEEQPHVVTHAEAPLVDTAKETDGIRSLQD